MVFGNKISLVTPDFFLWKLEHWIIYLVGHVVISSSILHVPLIMGPLSQFVVWCVYAQYALQFLIEMGVYGKQACGLFLFTFCRQYFPKKPSL